MTLYVWESSLNSSNVIRFALKHESPSWCSKKGSLTTRSLESYAVLVPPGTEGTGNQYQYQKPLFRGTEIMFERYEEKRKLSSQKPDRLFLTLSRCRRAVFVVGAGHSPPAVRIPQSFRAGDPAPPPKTEKDPRPKSEGDR